MRVGRHSFPKFASVTGQRDGVRTRGRWAVKGECCALFFVIVGICARGVFQQSCGLSGKRGQNQSCWAGDRQEGLMRRDPGGSR